MRPASRSASGRPQPSRSRSDSSLGVTPASPWRASRWATQARPLKPRPAACEPGGSGLIFRGQGGVDLDTRGGRSHDHPARPIHMHPAAPAGGPRAGTPCSSPSGADHEELPPELVRPYAALPWRCRGASCPRSRPDFSRRLEPSLKPLFSRAVHTVAWNDVRGCGCRCRAARLSVPERLPGRKWTCTSSPQSVGWPRAGETGGGSSGSPR